MYRINTENNEIEKLEEHTFKNLGFKEREHLQEWIAKEPSVFDEELLIIQKEFSGFDTRERPDLFALDKEGSLVTIEIKLDDSGKDVTWQALKYASYCSSLTKEEIKDMYQEFLNHMNSESKAEEKLSEFFDNRDYEELILNKASSQRIILTAANFRKEVTSTVLWLLNFDIRIQCFRVTPFSMGDSIFLNFERVIPTPDTEKYMVGMAKKAQEDMNAQSESSRLETVRLKFWAKLIEKMNNSKSDLYSNISPGKYNWISASTGVRGVGLNFVVSRTCVRSELYIDRGKGNEKENEFIFNQLYEKKSQIEENFRDSLEWERLDGKQASRVKYETSGNIQDEEQWDGIIEFMVGSMNRLEESLKNPLSKVKQELSNLSSEQIANVKLHSIH